MQSIDILKSLTSNGISFEQITQEIIWVQYKGVDLHSIKGTADYMTLSRTGRDFAMNRRQRLMIAQYVQRVANITITNCEVAREMLNQRVDRDMMVTQSVISSFQ